VSTDTRHPYPTCTHCGHVWHGLPCTVTTTLLDGRRTHPGPCGCPSPWDDDYWNGPPA